MIAHALSRSSVALLLGCLIACGPGSPDASTGGSTGGSTGASGPTGTSEPTTGAATTGGGASSSTAAESSTSTGTGEVTTAASATDSGGTTELGPCVVDPAQDVCSAACDFPNDCCQCEAQKLAPDPGAVDCKIAAGIVTAVCPWSITSVRIDGAWVEQDVCEGPGSGWTQTPENGDIVVELCGDACTTYLAGDFAELEIYVFCEVA